jgi:hypothetical protein
MSARKPPKQRVSAKASNFENLAYDLAPGLVALEKEGKIKFPCEVILSGADAEMLGSFDVDGNGRFFLASEDRRIVTAVFSAHHNNYRLQGPPFGNNLVPARSSIA